MIIEWVLGEKKESGERVGKLSQWLKKSVYLK